MNGCIVHRPYFKAGLVRIQDRKEVELNLSEKRVVQCLLVSQSSEIDQGERSCTIMESAMNRLREDGLQEHFAYINTNFLIPTYSLCEQLVSIAEKALTNRRHSILPLNLESQLFLFMNREL